MWFSLAKMALSTGAKVYSNKEKDYKDEFVLIILSAPIIVLAWAVFSDDPAMMDKIELFFHHLVIFQYGFKLYGLQ